MREGLKEEAQLLARYYLQHCLDSAREPRPPNKAAFTLRKVADQMVEQHQAAFSNMKSRFDNGLQMAARPRQAAAAAAAAAGPEGEAASASGSGSGSGSGSAPGREETDTARAALAAADFLRRVVEEMSADEKMNWGRVVSIFAFAGVLCRHLRDSGITMSPEAGPSPVDSLAESVANYLGKERREWIEQNGGWEGFLRFFGSDDHWQESTVRNMLITVAGFGIAGLACLLAVR
ncbi:bcl-2-like protein 10 [Carcharodon carcharias]|uniref:bcl-2-like protein 10 n=1 Tax=Carcharodon carcharias TaxID=13397 RepID=UPI001B7F4A6A|nr:bcl-2-like protein 10 [Carcharodon carcharias]